MNIKTTIRILSYGDVNTKQKESINKKTVIIV